MDYHRFFNGISYLQRRNHYRLVDVVYSDNFTMTLMIIFGTCMHAYYSDCPTSTIRLSGGSDVFEGRVEICRNGLWGTVSSSSFDSHDATVVCRELGFLQAGLVTSKKNPL